MPALLVLAFIAIPLIELAVILQVGAWIGVWPTIVLLLLNSLLGAWLVRREGRRAWRAFRVALAESRWPGDEVTQGALILGGGALLLTPGFVTDAAGLLMILPPTRAAISRVLRHRLTPAPLRVVRGMSRGREQRGGRGGREHADQRPDVLDVEVVSVERSQGTSSSSGGSDRGG